MQLLLIMRLIFTTVKSFDVDANLGERALFAIIVPEARSSSSISSASDFIRGMFLTRCHDWSKKNVSAFEGNFARSFFLFLTRDSRN